jgi:hypothetical protein
MLKATEPKVIEISDGWFLSLILNFLFNMYYKYFYLTLKINLVVLRPTRRQVWNA